MDLAIFIRTYPADFQWLSIALRSIHEHVHGFREIVVASPHTAGLQHLSKERVVHCSDLKDGYLGQQLTKLEAWKHTNAEYVLYWDSDVVAKEHIDIEQDFFLDGRPILYKTAYAEIDAPWQPITAKAVGFVPEYEYMRRMPLVYRRSDLQKACMHIEYVHKRRLATYLREQPQRSFSEFNAIGALVEKYVPQEYTILDTAKHTVPPAKVRQFWSWGGFTEDVKKELSSYGYDV